MAIWKHHRGIVFIQGETTDGADEPGVGAVRVWQRVSQLVEVTRADRAVRIPVVRVLLVTMTINGQGISRPKLTRSTGTRFKEPFLCTHISR